MFAVCAVNSSSAINIIETVSPIFAHVESELLEEILTTFNVGLVLSNVTVEPSVVLVLPLSGFPAISRISPVSNNITP